MLNTITEHSSSHRAIILPIVEGAPRPLWSVMIPTHNCAKYLRQTLESVLAQAPEPDQMQIEVVDDFSTQDDPEAVVHEVGGGRVAFFRQTQNVGHVRNFETCLQRARGILIHQLHGDDYVREGFYSRMEKAFQLNPEAGAAFCRSVNANQAGLWVSFSSLVSEVDGVLKNFAENQALRQRIQTPSIVVKRSVYERLGGFDRRLSWTEDWEMWTRIACHYPIYFEPEPLAVYRQHDNSSTQRKIISGENVRDIGRCLSITSSYFPTPVGDRIRSKAAKSYSIWCMKHFARSLLVSGRVKAAYTHVSEVLKLSMAWSVLKEIISFEWLHLRILCSEIKQKYRKL